MKLIKIGTKFVDLDNINFEIISKSRIKSSGYYYLGSNTPKYSFIFTKKDNIIFADYSNIECSRASDGKIAITNVNYSIITNSFVLQFLKTHKKEFTYDYDLVLVRTISQDYFKVETDTKWDDLVYYLSNPQEEL